jgi:hypothetical protein
MTPSADIRQRSLAQVRSEDMVLPSAARRAKLAALRPTLTYLGRDSVVEIRILKLGVAWVSSLDGPVVLLSEGAIDLLSVDELQAVVAHELAHEYFAEEYDAARASRNYEITREVELRCDAVAIITLTRLGLDPRVLLSATARVTQFNESRGYSTLGKLAPNTAQRRLFWGAMVEFVAGPDGAGQQQARN